MDSNVVVESSSASLPFPAAGARFSDARSLVNSFIDRAIKSAFIGLVPRGYWIGSLSVCNHDELASAILMSCIMVIEDVYA